MSHLIYKKYAFVFHSKMKPNLKGKKLSKKAEKKSIKVFCCFFFFTIFSFRTNEQFISIRFPKNYVFGKVSFESEITFLLMQFKSV